MKTLWSLRSGITKPEFSRMAGKTWIMREPNEEDGSSEQSYTATRSFKMSIMVEVVASEARL